MNTQQPKALQFADEIFKEFPYYEKGHQWSAELRRLHSVNAELLEALEHAREQLEYYELDLNGDSYNDLKINAAIAKAQE